MKKLTAGLAGIFLLLAFNSCESNTVYDQFYHVENASWHWDDPAQFSFELDDTSAAYNILVQLRHTTEYPLSNLYMFVNVEGPSGQAIKDTIKYTLAEPDGQWVGKGVGSIRALGYLYKRNTMFPEPGTYTISIEQAMRLPELPVSDVGVRIESVNP